MATVSESQGTPTTPGTHSTFLNQSDAHATVIPEAQIVQVRKIKFVLYRHLLGNRRKHTTYQPAELYVHSSTIYNS